ncbi:sorbitol-6-phosphate dehydrogenase subunit [Vibrio sp. SA48]
MSKNKWLEMIGKVVIVTGGSGGIGLAICENLKSNGCVVIAADRTPSNGEHFNDFVECDITDLESVKNLVSFTINKYGRVDGLINNAGVNKPRLLFDFNDPGSKYQADIENYEFIMNVNVKGAFLCSQAVVPYMKNNSGGVIVNISSEAGVEGSIGQSIYSASKGAINSFTRSWAKELGKYNVRVVGLSPGINKRTNMNSDENYKSLAYTRGAKLDNIDTNYANGIPLGRVGEHSEIADLVSYLVSDHSSYITGTTINITGGKSR